MGGKKDDKKLRVRREQLRRLGRDLDDGALGQIAGGDTTHGQRGSEVPAGQVVSRCCS